MSSRENRVTRFYAAEVDIFKGTVMGYFFPLVFLDTRFYGAKVSFLKGQPWNIFPLVLLVTRFYGAKVIIFKGSAMEYFSFGSSCHQILRIKS
jgi:hypothetical protein